MAKKLSFDLTQIAKKYREELELELSTPINPLNESLKQLNDSPLTAGVNITNTIRNITDDAKLPFLIDRPIRLTDTIAEPTSTKVKSKDIISPIDKRLIKALEEESQKPFEVMGQPTGMTKGQQLGLTQLDEYYKEANKPLFQKAVENVNRQLRGSIGKLNRAFKEGNILERGADVTQGVIGYALNVVMTPMNFFSPAGEDIGIQVGKVTTPEFGKRVGEFLPFLTMPNPIAFYGAALGSDVAVKETMNVVNDTSLSEENKERVLEGVGLASFIATHRVLGKGIKSITEKGVRTFLNEQINRIDEEVRGSLNPKLQGEKQFDVRQQFEKPVEKPTDIEGEKLTPVKETLEGTLNLEELAKEKVDNNLVEIKRLTETGKSPEEISLALNVPLKEVKDAIQKPETKGVDVGEQPRISEEVGKTYTEEKITKAGEEKINYVYENAERIENELRTSNKRDVPTVEAIKQAKEILGDQWTPMLEEYLGVEANLPSKVLRNAFDTEIFARAIIEQKNKPSSPPESRGVIEPPKVEKPLTDKIVETPAIKIVTRTLENNFGIKILGGIEKPRGMTGKDIDVVLRVDDLSKIEGKELRNYEIELIGKPIDVFVTDGKRVLVSEQINRQTVKFTETPESMGSKKLKLSKETSELLRPPIPIVEKQSISKTPKTKVKNETIERLKKEALEEGIERSKKTTIGFDPTSYNKTIQLGAEYVKQGLKTFTEWSKQMIADLGEKIKPHLLRIWDGVKKELAKGLLKIAESPLNPARSMNIIEGGFLDRNNKIIQDLNKPRAEQIPKTKGQVIEKNVTDKLISAIKGAGKSRKETEKLYHQERQKRYKALLDAFATSEGEESLYRALATQKGELPKADFDTIRSKFTQDEVGELFNVIGRSDKTKGWRELNAKVGLAKLLDGKIPGLAELKLLEDVFGKDLIKAIFSKMSNWEKAKRYFLEAINIPRALMASMDMSAPLRQGLVLTIAHPKQSIPAFAEMHKYFFSDKAFKELEKTIENNPDKGLYEQTGLYFGQHKGEALQLAEREEAFMSKFADKIPWVKWAERAYLGYLNKLRADVFSSTVRGYKEKGITYDNNPKIYNDLAKYINIASGRGDLGKNLSKIAPLLNGIFFSPRNVAAKLQLLNPVTYAKLDPIIRKQAMKDMLTMISVNTSLLSLAVLGGIGTLETDSRGSDFMKLKIGNTRLDPWGGFQQPIRYLAQFISGQTKSIESGKVRELSGETFPFTTRLDLGARFVQSKLSPQASIVTDVLRGKDIMGKELEVGSEIYERIMPLYLQDAIESSEELGYGSILATIPAFYGMGLQTYEKRKKRTKLF